jgi:hypothetical protein
LESIAGEMSRSRNFPFVTRVAALLVIALAILAASLPPAEGEFGFATLLFRTQDILVLCTLAVVLLLAERLSPPFPLSPNFLWRPGNAVWAPWLFSGAALIVAVTGTALVFRHTPVSADEFLAEFDAAILASGRLAAPVPEAFRFVIRAMQPVFYLEIPGDTAWISSYLPGNAGLRALFGLTIGTSWCSPVLAGLTVFATFRVGRLLWPLRPDAAALAALLLATTPQFLITAMTPYSMTAHVAVNMVWLWLFMINRPIGHAAAAAVGFVGVGLHQFVFHPLFVLPFGLLLIVQRRYALAAFYAAAYCIILAFWMNYPGWIRSSFAATPEAPSTLLSVIGWVSNVYFGQSGHAYLGTLTTLNLARFVAWQNPALLILFAMGMPVLWRGRPIERAIVSGVLLTAIAVALILPLQGNGWGYRYVHGQLGSIALVAAAGWIALGEAKAPRAWANGVAALTLATTLVLLPLSAVLAGRFTWPLATALDRIARSQADIVVVDSQDIIHGIDLVRNRPDLSNTPRVVLLKKLDEQAMRKLCAGRNVAVFDKADAEAAGMTMEPVRHEKSQARLQLEALCPIQAL